MAVVETLNSNWKQLTGKTLSTQSQDVSRLKEAIVCVTIGACCNYPKCAAGYTVDLSLGGRLSKVIWAEVENVLETGACCCVGVVATYRRAAACAAGTGTLHLYEATANACNVPLAEIPACGTDGAGKSFRMHVIGY